MGIPKELADCNARPILSLLVRTIRIEMLQVNSFEFLSLRDDGQTFI